jgi:large subunit ribosomal protein L23
MADTNSKVDSVAIAQRIALRPVLTEAAVRDQEKNQATFRVTPQATKHEIKLAVQEVYGVKPVDVRTAIFHPKRRVRGATIGSTKSWKKAYVTVADIKSLNLLP